jgi:hypothetical protein
MGTGRKRSTHGACARSFTRERDAVDRVDSTDSVMRHLFEARLVNDPSGDPGLYVDLPCLAFAMEEKARPRVAKDRLAALGVATGPWLRELKRALLSATPADTPIRLCWRDRRGEHEMTRSVGELSKIMLDVTPGLRIGYVTDLRFSDANRRTLESLITGVDQLFIESVFLEADREHALRKNHLTARQAGQIARDVGARAVVPFHFSLIETGLVPAERVFLVTPKLGGEVPADKGRPTRAEFALK